MEPGLIIAVLSLIVAAIAGYIAYEQLRRTPKPQPTHQAPEKPSLPERLPPCLEHPYTIELTWSGRVEYITRLNRWIDDRTDLPICCIEGLPGIGKSSLAWKWLQDHIIPRQNELELHAIFQWSFGDGETNLGQCLESLCNYLQIDVKDKDPIATLRNHIDHKRILIILDNFEHMLWAYSSGVKAPQNKPELEPQTEDRDCIDVTTARLLRMLTTLNGPRTLIVSRLFPGELDGSAKCLRLVLDGLNQDEVAAYFRNNGIKGLTRELQSIGDYYGGHPMSIKRLVNVLHYDIKSPDDINRAHYYISQDDADLLNRQQHILQSAFSTLPLQLQQFMEKLAAVRGPAPIAVAHYLAGSISEYTFSQWLRRLVNDSWLIWERERNFLILHPVVRHYAYACLEDRALIHEQLRQFYDRTVNITNIDAIKHTEDLSSLIELYYHTARTKRYNEAATIFLDHLYKPISIRFGMITTLIELVSELFPNISDPKSFVTDNSLQIRVLNVMAYAYRLAGRSELILYFYQESTELAKTIGGVSDIAFGLRNMLRQYLLSGNINSAYEMQSAHSKLADDSSDLSLKALGFRDMGVLKSVTGDYLGAKKDWNEAERLFTELKDERRLGMVWAYRARLAKWENNIRSSLEAAKKARELANVEKRERDIIWSEWQLGSAYRMASSFAIAETHLSYAINSCRRTGMIDLEADILIDLARLFMERDPGRNENKAILDHANEAQIIANRCGYRLVQADLHNLLALVALKRGDLKAARQEADLAKEVSYCDGYVYSFAFNQANSIIEKTQSE